MSDMVDDLITYLAAVTPSLGLLVKNTMPADPDKVLVLRPSGGAPGEFGFGVPGLLFENPGLQLFCRGEADDEVEPLGRIRRAYLELCKIQGMILPPSNVRYLMLRPQQAPFKFQTDPSRRVEFLVNFLIEKDAHPS
jgi:hypothetical protein